MIDYLPVSLQTLWADLNEIAWTGNLKDLTVRTTGSLYSREVKGRRYWYWRPPTHQGQRDSPRYLGLETPELLRRLDRLKEEAESHRARRDMVRSLRSARLPAPDPVSGEVLAALAEAGVFRLRAILIGAVAMTCYPGLLGARLPASLARTSDLDIGQFHAISLAVEDQIDEDMEALLKQVDPRFRAVPDAFDSRRTQRYALRIGGNDRFYVDFLSPLRGPDRGRVTRLKALRTDAQLIRFLDYLLYQELNAVVLHGAGIPVNVPAPERFALHKLMVAASRMKGGVNVEKARKDISQAQSLLAVLLEMRPHDVNDAWQELIDRGPSWKLLAGQGREQLPHEMREALVLKDV